MFKKIVCMFIILLTTTSLFAFAPEDVIIYPLAGFGASGGSADCWSGATTGNFINSDPTLFKDAEVDPAFAYSIGVAFDYFLTDSLAIVSGLTYDSTPFNMVYERGTAANDLEISMDFSFLTIPAGVHYYIDETILLGGGLYYGILLNDDSEMKYGSNKEDVKLENTNDDLGMFIDLGLNFNIEDDQNVLVYLKYKQGLTDIYDEDDMVTNVKTRSITINFAYGIKI